MPLFSTTRPTKKALRKDVWAKRRGGGIGRHLSCATRPMPDYATPFRQTASERFSFDTRIARLSSR